MTLLELAKQIDEMNKAEERGEKVDQEKLVSLCLEGKNRMERGE